MKHFRSRIGAYPAVFERVTGMRLYPGTLNVDVGRQIRIIEQRRLVGAEIGEPEQDLLFEACIVAAQPCFRVRPLDLKSGGGGHGDHILEIVCAAPLRPLLLGSEEHVSIEFPHR